MADLEARRAARNRKILQNREKRMNTLYGRKDTDTGDDLTSYAENNSKESESVQQDIYGNNETSPAVTKQKRNDDDVDLLNISNNKTRDSESISHFSDNTVTREAGEIAFPSGIKTSDRLHSQQSDTDTVRHRATRNTVKIQQSTLPTESKKPSKAPSVEEDIKPSSATERSPQHQFNLLRLAGCVFVAILSRVVLQLGIGLFYFQTIVLPFAALQGALYYYKINFVKDIPYKGTAMSSALMLCGLKPEVITTYNKIMGNIAGIYEDFSIYLFAFFCSNMLMT
ncbi:guided entry of tail-anchored proteins factor CAMLG-like [Argopecten irradians]|uniref:guided entry of tail-anchored proteins factor CAMLG-like n=1 Tax=Argopecten irradians TaxID=31199 RepID=UPI00372446B0